MAIISTLAGRPIMTVGGRSILTGLVAPSPVITSATAKTRHRWAIGPAGGDAPTRELTHASGRRVTVRVDAAADAQFSINGRSSQIRGLGRLEWDLWVYLEQSLIFRGRLFGDQGSINANKHSVQFSALDYRGLLNKRVVGVGGAHYAPGTDQATIPWGLIAASQALPGGDWGITNGAGATSGTPREANYDPGKPLGDAIGELGRLANGFEWEIDADRKLNRYYPRRGVDRGTILDIGGQLTQVDYGYSGDDFGNAGLVTGDLNTTPVAFQSATVASDPRGRMEKAEGFPSVSEQATLDAKGPWYLAQIDQVRPNYRCTYRARKWDQARQRFVGGWGGPTAAWAGDVVYPSFRDGWVDEDGTKPHRIVELQIVPNGENGEVVQVGLLAVPT